MIDEQEYFLGDVDTTFDNKVHRMGWYKGTFDGAVEISNISDLYHPQDYERIYNALVEGKDVLVSIDSEYLLTLSGAGFKDLVSSTFDMN